VNLTTHSSGAEVKNGGVILPLLHKSSRRGANYTRVVLYHRYARDESLSPQHGASSGCGRRNGLQLWSVAANILNKQPRSNDKGWFSSLRVGRGTNNPSP
jgi:hypothetical protein